MKRNRLTRGHGEKVVQHGSVGERAKAVGNVQSPASGLSPLLISASYIHMP